MECPRCGGTFETFTAETTGQSAVVCATCGYTDIAASHHSDSDASESWDQARERLDDTGLPPAATFRTQHEEEDVPTADSDETTFDPDRLDEGIKISPRRRSSENDDTDESDY
jgi:DNA-directed RNA polymerase subunit M/transcription elongation factor TFIIS